MSDYNTAMLRAYEQSEYVSSCRAERETEEYLDDTLDAFQKWYDSEFDASWLVAALAHTLQSDKEAERIYGYSCTGYAGEMRALHMLTEDFYNRVYKNTPIFNIDKHMCDTAVVDIWIYENCNVPDYITKGEVRDHIMSGMGWENK